MDREMPRQVRNRILAEHAVLRTALDELEALLDAVAIGGAGLGRRLRRDGAEFFAEFSAHLDVEDAALVSALRKVEDGDRMASRLAREHREQRESIRELLGQLEDEAQPIAEIAHELRAFVNSVRIDMENEETTMLREGLMPES